MDVLSAGSINAHGRALLALCRNTGMRILNGRTPGDLSGAFTFHSVQGSSLLDYVLVCPSMMERVVHMGVVHAGFSDHDALIVQVHRGRPDGLRTSCRQASANGWASGRVASK